MGDEDGDEDARPAHPAYVDEFCLGVDILSPTTNTRGSSETPTIRLLRSGRCPSWPRARSKPNSARSGGPTAGTMGRLRPDEGLSHPVTLVTGTKMRPRPADGWRVGPRLPIRLPPEAEWERAVRGGVDGRAVSVGRPDGPFAGARAAFGRSGRGKVGLRPWAGTRPTGLRSARHGRERLGMGVRVDRATVPVRGHSSSMAQPGGRRDAHHQGESWSQCRRGAICDVRTGTKFRRTATPTASAFGSPIPQSRVCQGRPGAVAWFASQ